MSWVNRSDVANVLARWREMMKVDEEPPPRTGSAGDDEGPPLALADGVDWPAEATCGRPASERLLDDLLRWEGSTRHMYLDTRGLVTVGIGNMLPSEKAARQLPFVDVATGQPATDRQIADAFAAVAGMPEGLRAGRYAAVTSLRLPEATVRQLAVQRLDREFLPALRRQFPDFDRYPRPAQRALVDMIYNLGAGGLSRFVKLQAACQAGDWARAAEECSRRTTRPDRNDWTRDLFLQAAGG